MAQERNVPASRTPERAGRWAKAATDELPALERFTSFDGVELAYRRFGTGTGRPVLLLHGYASTHRGNWVRAGVVDALVERGRPVVAMDFRGHGESDKPHDPAAYDGDAMVRDAAGLLDHLGIERVDVVGYSMGAMVAVRLAASDPRVRSAVLGGVGGDARPVRAGGALSRAMLAPSSKDVEHRLARAFRMFADLTGQDRVALAAVDRSESMRSEVDFDAVVVPVLVVAADKDALIAPPEELVARLPDARLVRVPGDHLNCVRKAELRDAIVAFLDEVAAGS